MRGAVLSSLLGILGLSGLLWAEPPGPPKNPHGTLDTDCGECHSPNRWVPVLPRPHFVHDKTGFPLQGAHAQASCRSCHRSLVFGHVATSCADCHRDPHNHELGTQCEKCHSPRTWTNQSEIFRAHSRTRFPLFAVHANVDCESCHPRNQKPQEYVTTPTTCGACHVKNYLAAQNPNHTQSNFSTRCEDCHSMTAPGWKTTRFTDHNLTRFPLAGAHRSVACERCHPGGRFTGTPTDCYSCHQANYQGTSNPNHVSGNFPRTCEACHSTNAWRPASGIDHNKTRFPLTGAHRNVDCARCHAGGKYAGTATDCYACHKSNYDGTSNPNHKGGGFPTSCASCHSTNGWRPASFDHNKTRFPLTGAHRNVDCGRCHAGGKYAGTATACYSCHKSKYDGTNNPNHAAASFPTNCDSCHSTSAWKPATFDHDGRYFPIYSGKHRGKWTACNDCHKNGGNYKAFECILCHEHSNKAKVDGDHKGEKGYAYNSQACYKCHPRGTH